MPTSLDERIETALDDLDGAHELFDPSISAWSQKYLGGHRARYKHDLREIANVYAGGDVLEIGSMPCHLTYCLKRLGYPVVGVDLEPSRAARFIQKHELQVVRCNIETEPLPFTDARFGLIIFNEIFEHLRINPIKTLRELRRVLNSTGKLILTTPNLYSAGNVVQFLLGRGFDNSPYQEFDKLNSVGHMGHVRVYSTSEVREFLENTGFRVLEVLFKQYRPKRGKQRVLNAPYALIPKSRPYQVFVCGAA